MLFRILTALMLVMFVGCASNQKKELTPAQKRAKLYYNQGTRDLVAQDYTKALTNLMEAAALDPKSSEIQNNLGMAYYFKNSRSKAVAHIKRSLELNPKNTDAKLNLASIYMTANKLELAEEIYLNILQDLTYQGQHRTHYNLGLIQLKRGRKDLAINQFNESLKVFPEYCPASYKLGEISYQAKSYKRALKLFKDASIGTCYNDVQPLRGTINALIKLERYPEAILALKDMQERFAMTEHESYARRTLLKVKALQSKGDEKTQSYSKNFSGEINSVDF